MNKSTKTLIEQSIECIQDFDSIRFGTYAGFTHGDLICKTQRCLKQLIKLVEDYEELEQVRNSFVSLANKEK
jgi:hypothetical protein